MPIQSRKKTQLTAPAVVIAPNSESIFDTSEDSENELQNAENVGNFGNEEVEHSNKKSREKPKKRWKDSELLIPPNLIYKMLLKGKYADRVRKESGVMLAGVIEYLVSEILDISRECANANQKKRITPRHLMTAIRSDEEFDQLLSNVSIRESGILPHIEEVLLKAPSPANRKRKMDKPGTSGVAPKKAKKMLLPVGSDDDSD